MLGAAGSNKLEGDMIPFSMSGVVYLGMRVVAHSHDMRPRLIQTKDFGASNGSGSNCEGPDGVRPGTSTC
jgi:hypothetical protein